MSKGFCVHLRLQRSSSYFQLRNRWPPGKSRRWWNLCERLLDIQIFFRCPRICRERGGSCFLALSSLHKLNYKIQFNLLWQRREREHVRKQTQTLAASGQGHKNLMKYDTAQAQERRIQNRLPLYFHPFILAYFFPRDLAGGFISLSHGGEMAQLIRLWIR